MNNNNLKGIVIDIDGVVADSSPWLEKHIEESVYRPLQFTIPRTFHYNIGIPEDHLLELIDAAIHKYMFKMMPCEYATTYVALGLLEREYGCVNFLTARSSKVHDITKWWLNTHFPDVNYNLNSIGATDSKFEWMKDNGFTAIVEDRFKTANEINFDNGYTFLVNRPWNTGRCEWNHVNRVRNLYEAVTTYIKWRERDGSEKCPVRMERQY